MSRRADDLIQKNAGGIDFGLGQQLEIGRLARKSAGSRMHQDQCEYKGWKKSLESVHYRRRLLLCCIISSEAWTALEFTS